LPGPIKPGPALPAGAGDADGSFEAGADDGDGAGVGVTGWVDGDVEGCDAVASARVL